MANLHLTDVERLTLENLSLKAAAAKRELDVYAIGLQAKYGGASVKEIRHDGTVVRAEDADTEAE